MSVAAMSVIVQAPEPADSGTTLTVEKETGLRFPIPPFARFRALVWPRNQSAVRGVNAEEITVLDIEQDTFTIERAESGLRVDIVGGMNIGLLQGGGYYEFGETVVLSETFDAGGPYALWLHKPQGQLESVDVGGTATYTFTPDQGGGWRYRFQNEDGVVGVEGDFFVAFSDTLLS